MQRVDENVEKKIKFYEALSRYCCCCCCQLWIHKTSYDYWILLHSDIANSFLIYLSHFVQYISFHFNSVQPLFFTRIHVHNIPQQRTSLIVLSHTFDCYLNDQRLYKCERESWRVDYEYCYESLNAWDMKTLIKPWQAVKLILLINRDFVICISFSYFTLLHSFIPLLIIIFISH
jgi:hypothetical protein